MSQGYGIIVTMGQNDRMGVPDKPFLLLDIDGCISPLPYRRVRSWEHRPQVRYGELPREVEWIDGPMSFGGRCLIDARLSAWMAELRVEFDLAWASSWKAMSNWFCEFLGLPELPWVPFTAENRKYRNFQSGKLPWILDFLGDRPGVWIDDSIYTRLANWAKSRSVPTLFIKTEPHIGIQRRHVDEMLAFARGLDGWRSNAVGGGTTT